jgi:hypothetical protein
MAPGAFSGVIEFFPAIAGVALRDVGEGITSGAAQSDLLAR